MYKVGICGHFGFGKGLINGQTDKTMAVYNALKAELGKEQIATLDTCGWQKNPLGMVVGCRKLLSNCENVIMMPARKGYKVFPRLFVMLNRQYNRKLHYVVVGGWLPDRLKDNPALRNTIAQVDCVYAELPEMTKALTDLGLNNAIYMPNFREISPMPASDIRYPKSEPYRLCTFSRINRGKGIEEAIAAVRYANRTLHRTAFVLHIYGKPEPEYEQRFAQLCDGFEPFIKYKGYISGFDESRVILKDSFAVLFPTFCNGEGFAGTIINAFASGVPVIATDWRYNPTIIRDGVDGIIYPTDKPEVLGDILVEAAENPQRLNSMRHSCLERSEQYNSKNVIVTLLNELGVDTYKEAREAATV